MIGIILFFSISFFFVGAIVLLGLIKANAGRIISVIVILLIFMGSMTFMLYKTSGQQDFFKTFDNITNLASSNQTQNSFGNNTDSFNEDKAEATLSNFLNAWQQQDIDELSNFVTDNANQKLNSELPLNKQPQIISYEILNIGTYDSQTGILPIKVKVTISYNDGTVKEIVFDYYLTYYYDSWYITDGSREDGNSNLFNFDQSQNTANAQSSNPTNTADGNTGEVLSMSGDTLAAGTNNTVGLKADGTVVATGLNTDGQLDISGWQNIVAISSGGYNTVGLKADGSVVSTGINSTSGPQGSFEDWRDIVAISAGGDHILGLKSDGTVMAVGVNTYGQLEVIDWRDIIEISAGSNYSLGIKKDGTCVVTGMNNEFIDEKSKLGVEGWQDIIAISGGLYHTLGLKADGTVVAVGKNNSGQCDVSGWQNIIDIVATDNHSLGLKSDGSVVVIGDASHNDQGQLNVSDWRGIVAISTRSDHTIGLKSDGTCVATGENGHGECDVTDWENIAIPVK